MARFTHEELERIKRDTNLAELIRSHGVELTRKGRDLVGLCPMHDDKEPSLIVTPHKHLWNCLGACNAGGSAIDWVMKAEKVSFRHAVEILRERLASAEPTPAPSTKLEPPIEFSAEDHELMRQVVQYYHRRLKESPAALEYLQSRGIGNAEAIDRFQIGFADRSLGLRLPPKQNKAGAEIRERLEKLGLYRKSGHEHFNGSIVFPVFDQQGHVVEIYGRKINQHLRKGTPPHLYLPGPHAGVWNMERENATDEIILCESIINALTFWCAGYRNVTASYGVHGFTDDHLAAFERCGKRRVQIAYDADQAGNTNALKLANERLIPAGLECFRVRFPQEMDANDYALKVTPAEQSLGVALHKTEWMGKGEAPSGNEQAIVEATGATTVAETAVPLSSLAAEAASSDDTNKSDDTGKSDQSNNTDQGDKSSNGRETVIQLGNRRYRVRGLERNLSLDQLKVNLLVSKGQLLHVDTFDLYGARPRLAFAKTAATELNVEESVIKADLGKVLLKLEELQDQQIASALDKKDEAPQLTDAEKTSALELLKSPNLLERIAEDFESCGVVGETTNKLVAYLATVSRKLVQPLAIVIQSSTAAGKSSLMDAVLALVPEEDVVKYSAMTGQSLFYMGETNLKHRILAIAEEEGAEQASYALKLLQSEGELTIASTGKDATTGRMETQQYRVEGPVMIFLTTTAIDVDEELMNRCIVLSVDEDREQTRAIHATQRQAETLEGLLARRERQRIRQRHQNAQRLLRPLMVVNPYAEQLTFLDVQTRTRRDHMKYLTLIRAVTLLYQYQRTLKTTEYQGETIQYIETTPQDIAMAHRLAEQILGHSIDELPPQTRRLLMLLDEMVRKECERLEMVRSDYRISRREIRDTTGMGNTQLKIHLQRLVDLEYVVVHRDGRRQTYLYELVYDGRGKEGQPILPGLVDVSKLEAKEKQDKQRQEQNAEQVQPTDQAQPTEQTQPAPTEQRKYDDDRSGQEARWSGQDGQRSGSGRGEVGPESGGGRTQKIDVTQVPPSTNGKSNGKPS